MFGVHTKPKREALLPPQEPQQQQQQQQAMGSSGGVSRLQLSVRADALPDCTSTAAKSPSGLGVCGPGDSPLGYQEVASSAQSCNSNTALTADQRSGPTHAHHMTCLVRTYTRPPHDMPGPDPHTPTT